MPLTLATLLFAGTLLFCASVIVRHAPGFVGFFWPTQFSLDIESYGDVDPLPRQMAQVATQLEALGFQRLGSHTEKWPLARPVTYFALVNRASRVCALVSSRGTHLDLLGFQSVDGKLIFSILSSSSKRATLENAQCIVSFLPKVSTERLFSAHVRRQETIAPREKWVQLSDRSDIGFEDFVALYKSHLNLHRKQATRLSHRSSLIRVVGAVIVAIVVTVQFFR